jgi:hypothetical protein
MIDASGQSRSSTSSSDSYAVDIFRPVALPGSRHLITPSELQGRRIAAEFVAKQIHLARAEGRDVTPVLTALAEAPALGIPARQGDPLFRSVRRYASDFLRHMHHKIGNLDRAEAKLRHPESRPTLPNFYRRSAPAE